jgi:GNAT superfamily N-acetyltransferase
MSAEDFEFAIRITDQMSWGLAEADFEFMIELEPEGCFVLLHDSERIGIATTVSFGRVGWFGNLIVTPDKRERGGGSFLVRHALGYLADRNVRTVGLYAYTEKIPFYTTLGFKCDSDFVALKGKGASSSILGVDVREATNQDISEIIDFDEACFGASRKQLLEPVLRDTDNFCYVSTENGRLSGFALAKVYHGMVELGPLVGNRDRSDIAIGLLTAALSRSNGFEVSMCVPKKEASILNMLTRMGFTERFRVARMFFGPPVTGDCVYAAESLERG